MLKEKNIEMFFIIEKGKIDFSNLNVPPHHHLHGILTLRFVPSFKFCAESFVLFFTRTRK